MVRLLVQGCSKSKNQPPAAVPALDLYSGFFFKIIKKAMREGDFDPALDLAILSAEHGLIDAETEIEWYDRRMDADRAAELAPQVKADLRDSVGGAYDTVVVNVGETYRRALDGITDEINADVHYVDGEGIGVKGHILKRVVRGETVTTIDQQAVTAGNS